MEDLIFDPVIFILLITLFFIYFALLLDLSQKIKSNCIIIFSNSLFFWLIFPLILPIFPYIRVGSLGGFDKSFSSALIQICFYASVVIISKRSYRNFFQNMFSGLISCPFLCVMLIMTMLSGFWSETPLATFRYSFVLSGVSLWSIHIAYQYNWQEFEKFLRWNITIVVILSLLVILIFPSTGIEGKGWTGIVDHPIGLGSLSALNLVLWLYKLKFGRGDILLCSALITISFIPIIFSNSSTALFILIATLSVIGWFDGAKKIDHKYTTVIIIFTLLISIVFYIFIAENYVSILTFFGKDPTLTGRTEFWIQLVDSIKKNPLFGYGINGFWQSWRGDENPANSIRLANEFIPTHAHNGYFETALSLGIAGLVLLIISHFNNIFRIFQKIRNQIEVKNLVLATILLTYLILFNVSSPGYLDITYIWFLYIYVTVRLTLDFRAMKRLQH